MEQEPFQKTRENAKIHKSSRNFKLLATVVCTAVALFTLYGKDHDAVTAIAKGYATITTPAGSCSAPLQGNVCVASVKPFSWWNCGYLDCNDYNVFGEVTDCNGAPISSVRITGYLTGDEASTSVSVLTDSKGRYRLLFPAYSNVTIIVKSSDYGNYNPEVSYAIKGKSAGSWVQKNIKLPCANACGTYDEYVWNGDTAVVINGVTWATRNVDAPGTFAATPESYGMYYQWNRSTGWYDNDGTPTGVLKGGGTTTTWDNFITLDTTWESVNDPSPAGWRLPAFEIQTLLDSANVSNKSTTYNGVNGYLFTDKTTCKSVFFPAAGSAARGGHVLLSNRSGAYWQTAQGGGYLNFFREKDDFDYISSISQWGYSVRCVAE
jgi:uncharacterized protein (TIGR02145 family)